MTRQSVRLGTEPDGMGVGYVDVDVPQEMIDAFDLVLTPVIVIAPGTKERAHISGWQLIPRTTIDTRPQAIEYPHKHIGESPPT